MHQLWDSTAKLSIMLSAYHHSQRQGGDLEAIVRAERPLLTYLTLFHRYAVRDLEIVPSNAFFLASYAARELADLYGQLAEYSIDPQVADLSFAYQLLAMEIFPLDITGVLQLAYQSSQEGRYSEYFRSFAPLGFRLRSSVAATMWAETYSSGFDNLIALVAQQVPDLINDATLVISALQQVDRTEDALYRKAVVLTRLLTLLRGHAGQEQIDAVLLAVGGQNFDQEGLSVSSLVRQALPAELRDQFGSLPAFEDKYRFSQLKNELYGALENPVHDYLRQLYYEVPVEQHQYFQYVGRLQKSHSPAALTVAE